MKPNGPFVFSYEHPMAICIDASGAAERSYFEPGPDRRGTDGQTARVYTRGIGEVFTELGRGGLPGRHHARAPARHAGCAVPATIVWRARKEGA